MMFDQKIIDNDLCNLVNQTSCFFFFFFQYDEIEN